MSKLIIATGHAAPGKPYTITTATADALADIAIANLDAANWRVCQQLGIILPGPQQGMAQHAAIVDAATKAVTK